MATTHCLPLTTLKTAYAISSGKQWHTSVIEFFQ